MTTIATMTPLALAIWAGFVLGLVFGAAGQISGFCLTRGFAGYWGRQNGKEKVRSDGVKLRAFALALLVAILLAQALDAAGLFDLRRSIYVAGSFSWSATALGGLAFGYGMVAANGCGARALVLLGQGNLRSLVVLLCLGVTAYMTLTGLLAPLRTAIAAVGETAVGPGAQSIPHLLIGAGMPEMLARFGPAIALAVLLAWFALRGGTLRRSPRDLAGGLIVGALIPAGWLATGWLGADDFDPAPLVSFTFVAPVGETIQYAMIATGASVSFAVASVTGVFAGSFIAAGLRAGLRLEGFSTPGVMARYMAGGALMGFGGALALGCSIGQGLSGLSTLAIGSFIAAGGIAFGALLALRGPLRLPAL